MSRKKTNISVRLDEVCKHLAVTRQNDLGKRYGVEQQTISNFTLDGKPGWRITTGLIRDGISVDWILTGMGEMLASSVKPEPMAWGCANLTTDEAQLVLHHRNASDNQKKYILEYSGIRSRNSEEFDKLGKGPNQTIHRLEAQAKLKKS